eukprot:753645-Hanusia_phi.AAC.4
MVSSRMVYPTLQCSTPTPSANGLTLPHSIEFIQLGHLPHLLSPLFALIRVGGGVGGVYGVGVGEEIGPGS